jgi:hypothetical protein
LWTAGGKSRGQRSDRQIRRGRSQLLGFHEKRWRGLKLGSKIELKCNNGDREAGLPLKQNPERSDLSATHAISSVFFLDYQAREFEKALSTVRW